MRHADIQSANRRLAPIFFALAIIVSVWPARADLLVSSFSGHRVLRFSETNGTSTGVFVANGSGGLNLPHGLAVGPDGNLYVASAGNDAVLRYNGTNGAFIDAFIPSANGVIDYPVWLEFRDGLLYVSSQSNNCVTRFNATNGAFVDLFVTNGSGGLNGPSGMTWGPDGHLYVVGRFGNHVLRYHGTNGTFLDAFVPASSGILAQPFGCHFGPDGNLYVVSGDNNKVARFHGRTGAYLNDFVAGGAGGLSAPNFMLFRRAQTFSTNIPGIGPIGRIEQRHPNLVFTEGPAADANGHVYFSDVQGNRIYKSDTNGLLSTFFPNSSACNGLMFDQAGRLVACQRAQQRIIAIDVATTNVQVVASNFAGRVFNGPNDLVVDQQGGVYFTDPSFAGSATATQSVYYAASNGTVTQVINNLSRPNGVILSPDETKLYVVLSGAANLITYPVNGPGVLGAPMTTVIPRTGDGMTIDTLGNLYLCQPGGSNITVITPGGTTLGAIRFPEQPANCTFGGKDMKTLFVTARTSVYTCRMEATGHRFAWNPSSFANFQRRFFSATNAPNSAAGDDPDADGASNELEYLTRTHPLCPGDEWKISLRQTGTVAQIRFAQAAGRGFEVQHRSNVPGSGEWEVLNVLSNPPIVSATNRIALIEDTIDGGTNRFYKVRVFQP